MKFVAISLLTASAAITGTTHAANQEAAAPQGVFGACLQSALEMQPGKVLAVKEETENEAKLYEFHIVATNGSRWQLECNAATGRVVEINHDIDVEKDQTQRADFDRMAWVDEAKAKDLALKKVPGQIIDVKREFEMPRDNLYGTKTPVFEVTVKSDKGEEVEVEINAMTGQVQYLERTIAFVGS